MSLIFADSFDHYTDLGTKYDSVQNGLISTGLGQSRTGTSCVSVTLGAFGPAKVIRPCLDVLIASAFFSSSNCIIYRMGPTGTGGLGLPSWGPQLWLEADRSLTVRHKAGDAILGQTAPGVYTYNVYNNIGFRCTLNVNGEVWLWVNGVLLLHLVGVDTRDSDNPTLTLINGVQIFGPGGGGGTCYHDDLYVLDCTDAVNNTYLGPLRIYESVPTADGVVQWTPSPGGGGNFVNVNEIPPDANTTYNSSGTIGQSDQYVHPLNGAVPANSQLFAVQHCMDVEVDTGSRAVTSDVGGVLNPNDVMLPSGYVIETWPYDENPITAAPWLASAFPLLAGPSVTA
jgi:hypothetical protein